jgi:hypothetical protein
MFGTGPSVEQFDDNLLQHLLHSAYAPGQTDYPLSKGLR